MIALEPSNSSNFDFVYVHNHMIIIVRKRCDMEIFKYPRTRHIEGSRCQIGDEDLESVKFSEIEGRYMVVEEKVDGANSGISFEGEYKLLLQSRGHYLTGGAREKHFNLFKTWANTYLNELWEILNDRYIMYGEWLYAKHTIYYNSLPHYFMEFDIYDKNNKEFLSTARRRSLLKDHSFISSVLVLHEGDNLKYNRLIKLIGKSNFINGNHIEELGKTSNNKYLDTVQVLKETDNSNLMEGLYIKVEEDGIVKERYKYVRASFLTSVSDSESHWLDRPIIENGLKDGINLFDSKSFRR